MPNVVGNQRVMLDLRLIRIVNGLINSVRGDIMDQLLHIMLVMVFIVVSSVILLPFLCAIAHVIRLLLTAITNVSIGTPKSTMNGHGRKR